LSEMRDMPKKKWCMHPDLKMALLGEMEPMREDPANVTRAPE